ncbi:glutamyl-tRNA(Gln) amidotransferase subunit A [Lentilactobacillus senioris DSM 24302 = JCM 17472]|uniref:Glutamyl-tRNA(Gln) amidotransferase subunit A n=1 Tax=Lentilactobacillus senioris DSM 24302 = JCM 17472 TaxID=1423802 RepID=A0A0R2CPA8_9LACO|nr:Asp-tRNA(Asn)/Glu-tRNA(Gln) amidotransferase subunit GatA [Lentilactobacillus senioris]KRM93109.1 glutamyl-tRNA(Gln) amidotransferase subunit A [Lentilactobacillus senioris DSM 24302 = JCM 17472]
MNYFDESLTSIHQKLVAKEMSATELAKQTIANMKETDKDVQAFITINEDEAISAAEKIDAAGVDEQNILSGIPVGIKDNLVTKGVKTTAASKMLGNFKPIYTATAVQKLTDAGMVMVGKTNMDEFAMGGSTENSAFKTTKNPWDYTKVPGGSSGGSAAAVASGQVLGALGSDTGGSIRQPASFNGIVGMKPTYGRVSRWGLIAFGSSFDQIGPFTKTVADNAAMLTAIAGQDQHDLTSSDKAVPNFAEKLDAGVAGMTIGLPTEYLGEGVDDSVKQLILAAAKTYEQLGAKVVEVSLPHTRYGVAAYYILSSSEASSNLQRFDGIRYGFRADNTKNLEDIYVQTRSQGFGDEVKRRIMLGTYSLSAGFYDAYFKKAAQVRTLMINDYTEVFKNVDLILAPTAPTTAYALGAEVNDPMTMYMNDAMTIPVNMAGLPGLSMPVGFADGMPVGMQLIGRPFDEVTVYQAANAFEKATDFHKQNPQLGGQN